MLSQKLPRTSGLYAQVNSIYLFIFFKVAVPIQVKRDAAEVARLSTLRDARSIV